MITVGSLFSGIGGLDLGLERAGMVIRWQVEIDSFCQKVLAKHWPHVKRYGDIKLLDGSELEPVDLICGGFPCQPVSVAGKRKGVSDERWLWPEFARLLRILRPRYALIENVPGLLRLGMGEVLSDLAAAGYDAEWQTLSASQLGAAHRRERVFIIAHTHGLRFRDTLRGLAKISIFSELPTQVLWSREYQPPICRENNGVPARVDRLRGLGNAVVPQVAEWLGRQIMAFEELVGK